MALWGKTDANGSRPKYLGDADLAKCIFVDSTEAQQPANKARGLHGAGWWLYTTYTDASGDTRHKPELLVAMQETALAAGDRSDDGIAADANYVITISAQPENYTSGNGGALFEVTAAVTSGGGTLSYQWQVKPVGTTRYTDIDGETSSGIELSGLTLDNNGDQFRVKIKSANGAKQVTSDVATLTVVD